MIVQNVSDFCISSSPFFILFYFFLWLDFAKLVLSGPKQNLIYFIFREGGELHHEPCGKPHLLDRHGKKLLSDDIFVPSGLSPYEKGDNNPRSHFPNSVSIHLSRNKAASEPV